MVSESPNDLPELSCCLDEDCLEDGLRLPTPPPDYSSPDKEPSRGQCPLGLRQVPVQAVADFLQLTGAPPPAEDQDDSEGFENGFYFPQPPSPNLFTEAPTPEFVGENNPNIKNKVYKLAK